MQPKPIETAPKDREILVYGEWRWESVDSFDGKLGWKVAKYADYISRFNEESFEYEQVDAFSSVTENPYADYSVGILWCELPTVET